DKGMIKARMGQGKAETYLTGEQAVELAAVDSPETSAGLTIYLRWSLKKTQRISGKAHVSHYRIAQLCAELGNKDRAFASLAEAFSAHDPMLIFLKVDPAYDGLRSDPRFAALVQRSGLSS